MESGGKGIDATGINRGRNREKMKENKEPAGAHRRPAVRKAAIVIFWLLVWQLAAWIVDNSVLLAGPAESLTALGENAAGIEFWKAAGYSSGRICLGFLSAFVSGILLGSAAWRFPLLQEILSPAVSALRAVPVAVFAVIVLIWFGSTGLTVWVSFLIVFPQVYTYTIGGLNSTDRQLLEMAQVMGTEKWKKIFFIYRPALLPFLSECCKTTIGMSWKSGIAAEVIGTPAFSIGERLYLSKIYLDTAGIFAWTFVIVLLSLLFEKIFLRLFAGYAKRQVPFWVPVKRTGKRKPEESAPIQQDVRFCGVHYSYGQEAVLTDVSLILKAGKRYCLFGESGRGKTTLLRLAAGLLQPDEGSVDTAECGMMFQENRLCGQADAVWNVCMARGVDCSTALRHLKQVLEEKDCRRPVCELSGGMQRRVALCRSVASRGSLLLLDEPFNGLDEANRGKAAGYVRREQQGRTILVATHREEDTVLLQAGTVRLP